MGASMSIILTQNSQNIANNTSSVTATVRITTNNGTWNQMGNAASALTIRGSYSASWNFNASFGKNTTTTVYTRTFTVNHAANGTASITASGSCNTFTSAGTITASKSLTLSTIPRASTPTVSGTTQLGSTMTINTNRKSSSFTHTISWSWAGKSGTIGSNVGASVTWTPDIATFAPYLTDAASATCTITCVTKNGSSTVGTKTTTFTLSIPSSVVPTLTSSSVNDTMGYLATYGAFVQNKSNIQVVAVAAGVYGSTITKYAASLGVLSAEGATGTLTLGALGTAGEQSVSITATDSRGRSVTGTKEIAVASYSPPVLNVNVYRVNTDTGVEDDESTTVRVEVTGSVCNINNANENSGTVKIEYRIHSSTGDWTLANNADRGQSFSFSYDISNISTANKYDVLVTVTDDTGASTSSTWTILTAKPILDFYKTGNGLAVGTVASKEDTLQFGYNLDLDALVNMQFNGVPFLQAQSESGCPVFTNHTALANGMYLQGQTSSGGYSDILRMNESDQVELNWTSGGLKGRVMKLLWEGRATTGAVLTIPDLPYYNILAFERGGLTALAVRTGEGIPSLYFYTGAVGGGATGELIVYVMFTTVTASNKLTLTAMRNMSVQSHISTDTILNRIWGIL